MMLVHGTDPIPAHRHALGPIISHFCLTTPPPLKVDALLSKWTPYVYHPLEKLNNSFLRFKSCVDTNALETWKAILAQYLKLSTVLEKL